MTVADQLRNEYKPQFIAEGIEKGIEKAAKGMLLEGISDQIVLKSTGLTDVQL